MSPILVTRTVSSLVCFAALMLALSFCVTTALAQPQKLLDLINDPWEVVWQNTAGHQIRVYRPTNADTAWVFAPDSATVRTIYAYVDGAYWISDPSAVAGSQVFELPAAFAALPLEVWQQWDGGVGWRFRLETSVQPILANLQIVFPRNP